MLRALLAMVPASLPAISHAGLDWRVFAFTSALSLLIGIVFGAVPAWHCTRYDTADGLREGGRGAVGGPKAARTRNLLVVIEVALAVVLLIGSVLLIQTFVRLTRVDTGFRSDRILTMEVTLPKSRYSPARTAAFFQSAVAGMSSVPGVEAAGITSSVPLSARESLVPVTIEGNPVPQPGLELIAEYRVVTPGYFRCSASRFARGAAARDRARALRASREHQRNARPHRLAEWESHRPSRQAGELLAASPVVHGRGNRRRHAERELGHVAAAAGVRASCLRCERADGDRAAGVTAIRCCLPLQLAASCRRSTRINPVARVRSMDEIMATGRLPAAASTCSSSESSRRWR
jgi:hypothetical protein